MMGPMMEDAAVTPAAIPGLITCLLHHAHLNKAEAAGVCNGGAGHGGEHHGRNAVCIRQDRRGIYRRERHGKVEKGGR